MSQKAGKGSGAPARRDADARPGDGTFKGAPSGPPAVRNVRRMIEHLSRGKSDGPAPEKRPRISDTTSVVQHVAEELPTSQHQRSEVSTLSEFHSSLLSELSAIREDVRSQCADVLSEVKETRTRVEDIERHLEARDVVLDELETRLAERETRTAYLEDSIEYLDMERRWPELILSGTAIPLRSGNPWEEDVSSVAVSVRNRFLPDVPVQKEDLTECIRIGKQRLLCRFLRIGPGSARQLVYERRFSLKVEGDGQPRPEKDRLFINENLIARRFEIFQTLMKEKKKGRLWTVFSKQGEIFCKVTRYEEKVRISHVDQIRTLFGE